MNKKLAEALNVLSYVALLVQALWAIMLYGSWLIFSGVLQTYIDQSGTTTSRYTFDITLPEFIRYPLAIFVVMSIVVLCVVLIRRTPETATQMTIHATERTAKAASPIVQKVMQVPKTHSKETNKRMILVTKLTVATVLLAASIVVQSYVELPPNIIVVVSVTAWIVTMFTSVSYYAYQRLYKR